jgi:hypothetical protein
MERMKDFVIKDFERFLEIADTISTPFKFLQLTDSDVGKDYAHLEAKVWMRTAYLTYEEEIKKEDPEKHIENLERHGFSQAEIRETAIPIK